MRKLLFIVLMLAMTGCGPIQVHLPEPLASYLDEFEEYYNVKWHGEIYVSDEIHCHWTDKTKETTNGVMCSYGLHPFNLPTLTDTIIFHSRVLNHPDEYLWYLMYHELGHYYFSKKHDQRFTEVRAGICDDDAITRYFDAENHCRRGGGNIPVIMSCPVTPMATFLHHDVITFCVKHYGKQYYRDNLEAL